jgi:hypothetical protein
LIELDHFDIVPEWGHERRDTPLRRVREVCEALRVLVNDIRKAWGFGTGWIEIRTTIVPRERK